MPASFDLTGYRLFLPFLMVLCFSGQHIPASPEGFHDDLQKGLQLTPETATLLEKNLASSPHDVSTRTQLLAHYMQRQPIDDPSILTAKREHVLWLVQNSPESEVLGMPVGTISKFFDPMGYSEGKEAWMTQLEKNPKNVTMLGNAANYLAMDDRESAIELLQRAQSLDPSNAKWSMELGHKYAVEAGPWNSPETMKQAADKALTQFENAYALDDESGKDALLPYLAKTAFVAEQLTKARKYAEIALQGPPSGWNYGNRIHHGNLILGRIALREGDIAEANTRLIRASKTPGSPQLKSFGPNMTLAKELLETGERDVVIEFFRLCAKFWDMEQGKLDEWAALVEEGKIPDFGANLRY